MLNGDNLDFIKKELPEELQKDFSNIVTLLEKKLNYFMEDLISLHEKTKHLSNKELGLEIAKDKSDLFIDVKISKTLHFIFAYRKDDFLDTLNDKKSGLRRRIFEIFRPNNNKLDGYVQSNSMNRFSIETE
jgi:hypothetical protein